MFYIIPKSLYSFGLLIVLLVDLKSTGVKVKMYDVFDEMESIQKEMNKTFNKFWGKDMNLLPHQNQIIRRPIADVEETDKQLKLEIELPGMDKKDINLEIKDNQIEIKAFREDKVEKKDEGEKVFKTEKRSFYRTFQLPTNVKSEEMKAEYKNGILKLLLPKQKQLEGKKIEIT